MTIAHKLPYRPPVIGNPINILYLGRKGGKYSYDAEGGDVQIVAPADSPISGSILIQNANNVVFIGGKVVNDGSATNALIEIENATGVIHMEGLYLDPSGGGKFQVDGFRGTSFTVGKSPSWVFQNINISTITNPFGSASHGACFSSYARLGLAVPQPFGPLKWYNCTFVTDYMGCVYNNNVADPVNGPCWFDNFNIRFSDELNPSSYAFYMTNKPDLGPKTYFGPNVYAIPHAGKTLGQAVFANGGNATASGAAVLDSSGNLIFNNTYANAAPYNGATSAKIHNGIPSTGDFCSCPNGGDCTKGDNAGVNYVSPGYV